MLDRLAIICNFGLLCGIVHLNLIEMGKFNGLTIHEVVDNLNVNYFIPDIQRSYVWLQNPKEKKIEQLFDSLLRGYPIGSFLFWKLKVDDIETDNSDKENCEGKLNFQLYKFIENYDVRRPHNDKVNITQVKSPNIRVVLDGQQRLTSLYIGLRGSRCLRRPYARSNDLNPYDEKFLYLNLNHRPSEDNPDDGYQFEFKTLNEVQQSDSSKLWFRVSDIVTKIKDRKDSLRTYCSERNYSREAEDVVTDLYVAICEDENINYFEEINTNLDKVLKIFIRVNSGGIQLSYSDLLMSLLTATFKSEIREKMENFVDNLSNEGYSCIGRDQVLKTCLLLSDCNHVFKLNNFSKANIRKIEDNWERITESITDAVKQLTSLGFKNQLSSGYIASIVAYYLSKTQSKKLSKEDKDSIAMFVRIAQIRGFFSAGLDTKLARCKDCFEAADSREIVNFSEFLKNANKNLEGFAIQKTDVEWYVDNVKYGSGALLPLMQLLYPNLNYGTTNFHVDHIYPKSKFTTKNAALPEGYVGKENNLFNLQLLEGTVNEEKKAKDPSVWLEDEFKTLEKIEKYKADNYIPQNCSLKWEELPSFEVNRKALIISKLFVAFNLNAKAE